MTRQEIIDKAQNIEKTMTGLDQLRELESYVATHECGCKSKSEWQELSDTLAMIRKEIKQEIKKASI